MKKVLLVILLGVALAYWYFLLALFLVVTWPAKALCAVFAPLPGGVVPPQPQFELHADFLDEGGVVLPDVHHYDPHFRTIRHGRD